MSSCLSLPHFNTLTLYLYHVSTSLYLPSLSTSLFLPHSFTNTCYPPFISLYLSKPIPFLSPFLSQSVSLSLHPLLPPTISLVSLSYIYPSPISLPPFISLCLYPLSFSPSPSISHTQTLLVQPPSLYFSSPHIKITHFFCTTLLPLYLPLPPTISPIFLPYIYHLILSPIFVSLTLTISPSLSILYSPPIFLFISLYPSFPISPPFPSQSFSLSLHTLLPPSLSHPPSHYISTLSLIHLPLPTISSHLSLFLSLPILFLYLSFPLTHYNTPCLVPLSFFLFPPS
jgi:hypothetical protein